MIYATTRCANGCDAPPQQPSKVLCAACFDAVDAKMQALCQPVTARLPTPDLLAGPCVHTSPLGAVPASECESCLSLALSRARDAGIETAAQAIRSTLTATMIRALKEDRPR